MMKRPEGTASFGWKEDDHYLTVSTEQFSYTYNKFTGLFEEMCYANQNLLDRPMERTSGVRRQTMTAISRIPGCVRSMTAP